MKKGLHCLLLAVLWTMGLATAVAQGIPSPKEHFGFNIGDNYQLATYSQTSAYFKKLAETSDRTV